MKTSKGMRVVCGNPRGWFFIQRLHTSICRISSIKIFAFCVKSRITSHNEDSNEDWKRIFMKEFFLVEKFQAWLWIQQTFGASTSTTSLLSFSLYENILKTRRHKGCVFISDDLSDDCLFVVPHTHCCQHNNKCKNQFATLKSQLFSMQ